MASVEENNPLALSIEQRQELKQLEDQIIDTLVVLDATQDTISVLLQKYDQFCGGREHISVETGKDIDSIPQALHEKEHEVYLHRRKVKALHKKVTGTISLVSIVTSPFLLCD